jgi:membrane protein
MPERTRPESTAGPAADEVIADRVTAREGHAVRAPHHLSAAAWRAVFKRVGRRLVVDRLALLSAGIAFFAVLSIAPVLMTALSVYGAVNTPEQALEQLAKVTGLLPPTLEALVADQLTTIASASTQVLTRRGLFGLVLALWTATVAATSLIEAITLAYHEDETRGFLVRTGLGLAMVLAGALLLGGLIAGAGVVSRAVDGGEPGVVRTVGLGLVWLGLGVLLALLLGLLYRWGPDRRPARWHWVSWGAVGATLLWLAASVALFAYVQSLGTYESTYGSLAGVAISMLWLWISVFLIVVGAAVNAEVERQTVHDSTIGPEQPVGLRGAVVADSVPPYPGD